MEIDVAKRRSVDLHQIPFREFNGRRYRKVGRDRNHAGRALQCRHGKRFLVSQRSTADLTQSGTGTVFLYAWATYFEIAFGDQVGSYRLRGASSCGRGSRIPQQAIQRRAVI
jgi:hypothetical protein